MMKKNSEQQKGIATLFMIFLLASVLILAAASIRYLIQSSKATRMLDDKLVAKEMAFAGLEMVKASIYNPQNSPKKSLKIDEKLTEGNFSVTIEYLPDSRNFKVISIGRCGRRETKLTRIFQNN